MTVTEKYFLKLYQVSLNNVTAGVVVSADGIVVDAAPVFERFVGQRFERLKKWVQNKNGSVAWVSECR